MGDVLRKIEEIEAEMARTQKNKATSAHLGILKAKLAKLRRELITPKSQGGSAKEESFEVAKTGDSRIGFVGFPSVGKSTLLTNLAGVYSEVAAYEFTTLTTVPGCIKYKGAKIQLLDLPGIIEGAKDGKGRGRQVCVMKFVCKSTSFPCLGYRSGTNRQHHLYCAGRAEASRPQENLGERVGRVRDPNEQGSTQYHLQEEGQGWNQPANHGASVRAGS